VIEQLGFVEAFMRGWTASASVAGLLTGVLLPWLPAALLGLVGWKLWRRGK